MPQKRHTVDQIVAKLRKADVELGKGKKVQFYGRRSNATFATSHTILWKNL